MYVVEYTYGVKFRSSPKVSKLTVDTLCRSDGIGALGVEILAGNPRVAVR